jgi:hypothetical protein
LGYPGWKRTHVLFPRRRKYYKNLIIKTVDKFYNLCYTLYVNQRRKTLKKPNNFLWLSQNTKKIIALRQRKRR